jgi:xanthine dehydrogenase molybdopterin-binding subunit B
MFLLLSSCRAQAAEKGWSFAQMATQAYMDRVDLSAHGFYATPEVTGQPSYFVCCIVEELS